jgi:hypothetical protein
MWPGRSVRLAANSGAESVTQYGYGNTSLQFG